MIRHYAAVRGAWSYSQGVQATSKDIFIGFLPMSHSYGCGSILIQPILLQSTVVLMDKFEVEKAFQIIEREKITLQLGAAPHYILELNHKKRPDYDLSSLRAGLIAGMVALSGDPRKSDRVWRSCAPTPHLWRFEKNISAGRSPIPAYGSLILKPMLNCRMAKSAN
jgi:acyl-CoA synthetase (AMP-forming)/AMP-acid ligase II